MGILGIFSKNSINNDSINNEQLLFNEQLTMNNEQLLARSVPLYEKQPLHFARKILFSENVADRIATFYKNNKLGAKRPYTIPYSLLHIP